MTNKQHAVLSASGSSRWLNCPGSVRIESTLPDTQTSYADEGTLAHELVELILNQQFDDAKKPRTYSAALNKIKKHQLYKPEMLTHAESYVDYINELTKTSKRLSIMFERKLSFTDWVPDSFGTCDTIIADDEGLHVIDYKYGQGVLVSVENNTQLKLYGLGAYALLSPLYDIKQIKMTIYQPRLNNISTDTLDIDSLLAFGEYAKAQAQKALTDNAEVVVGEWCRFCKANAICRVRAEKNIELAGFTKVAPDTLSNSEIGEYLTKGADVASWLSKLEDYALTALIAGEQISGYKCVEGRSLRSWKDQDAAINRVIELGYDEALVYNRVPLSLAKIEELLGKQKFNETMLEHVHKPTGKPTLALESDKRPVFNPSEPRDIRDIFEKEN